MATIYGKISIDRILFLTVSGDPAVSGGTPAPKGSVATSPVDAGFFLKTDTADTDWVSVVSGTSSWTTLREASLVALTQTVAGTYFMVNNSNVGPNTANTTSGTAIQMKPAAIYIDPADYPSIGALVPKLRIRANLFTNATAPASDFTFGLYPLTAPVSSGGPNLRAHTIGTVVTGSNGAVFSTPAADSNLNAVSADFDLPSAGFYCVCVIISATTASSSYEQLQADLQLHYTT